MAFREAPIGPPCKLCSTPTERQCQRCLMPWCEKHQELQCLVCVEDSQAIIKPIERKVVVSKKKMLSHFARGAGSMIGGAASLYGMSVGGALGTSGNLGIGLLVFTAGLCGVFTFLGSSIYFAYRLIIDGVLSVWNRWKLSLEKRELKKPKRRLQRLDFDD